MAINKAAARLCRRITCSILIPNQIQVKFSCFVYFAPKLESGWVLVSKFKLGVLYDNSIKSVFICGFNPPLRWLHGHGWSSHSAMCVCIVFCFICTCLLFINCYLSLPPSKDYHLMIVKVFERGRKGKSN